MRDDQERQPEENVRLAEAVRYYRIRFRDDGREFTAETAVTDLKRGDVVMLRTDHGLEPARITGTAPIVPEAREAGKLMYEILKRANSEEESRFQSLAGHESSAFEICLQLIDKHQLVMSLIRVEKFFNGSKMIFYFTAENRVDFRALVKDLVQEFRTRVEMRQVGVRHETKMIGGMGICGRELCCSSFMKKFDSVSIKMAKEQDLPLNPTKISGACNRLLCCLTYEYDAYRRERKTMPKLGRKIRIGATLYRVKRQNPLQQTIVVADEKGEELLLAKNEWLAAELLKGEKQPKKGDKKSSSGQDLRNKTEQ